MRLGRISLALLTALLALLLSNTAFANSVTMTYEGHQGVVAQNGSPYIGYPYYFSINGSSTYTPLLCDSYDNNVSLGQTFQATVSPFLQGIANSMFGPSMTLCRRSGQCGDCSPPTRRTTLTSQPSMAPRSMAHISL